MKRVPDTSLAHTIERPPIVVVLGHVDHGKSTLLDYIRKSNVAAHEAGGITQHVAAYEVEHPIRDLAGSNGAGTQRSTQKKKSITFIDTPGHAAFKTIRARGANIADIAILVVAADDGVKAQTLEALENIKSANIPFVVAINKIDKPNANVERTQTGLLEHGIYLERMGGDVPWVAISAKNGTGIDELLDLILLVAELQELRGDPSRSASGFCIEAHLDQKRGIAATLIIRDGSLRIGQAVCVGRAIAPVRIMENFNGKAIKEASLSAPVTLVGFDELPAVGEAFHAYSSKRDAEEARAAVAAASQKPNRPAPAPEDISVFKLPVIIRADTIGSLDAILLESARIGSADARIAVVHSGIGNVSESDIKTAIASESMPAIVLGFNVGVDAIAQDRARQGGIRIEEFTIIYKLVERLEELLRDAAPRKTVEHTVGSARVARTFSKRKDLQVIGGAVAEGHFQKNAPVRVFRRSQVVGVGKIKNLQAHKQDVERVEKGSEFGAQIEAVFEISQDDILECFITMQK